MQETLDKPQRKPRKISKKTFERNVFMECFSGFSDKFSYVFNSYKQRPVIWSYWGKLKNEKGMKCRLYLSAKIKGEILANLITNDDNIDYNTKKLNKLNKKSGYFVVIIDCVRDIKEKISYNIKINKVFRKARKRSALNLAHKFWWEQTHPDKEYVPYYKEEKRHISEYKIEKMRERGKALFQILSEKNKVVCPRCENVFSNFSKSLLIQCPNPACNSKFMVRQKSA